MTWHKGEAASPFAWRPFDNAPVNAPPDLLIFAVVAAIMAGAALLFVLAGWPRAARYDSTASTRAYVDGYRAELAALETERRIGVLSRAVLDEARADVERRVLRSAASDVTPIEPPRWSRIALAIALPLLAALLYACLRHPATLQRTSETAVSAATLAAHVDGHARDARGWVMLARELAPADRFGEAAQAYERALTFPKVARDAAVWTEYADVLGMAQGGSLEGRPAELISRALALDPQQPQALEMAGSAAYARRDYGQAAAHWRTLLGQLGPGDSRERELAEAIARSERLARTSLPTAVLMRRGDGVGGR